MKEKTYTEAEVFGLCLKAMNLGMSIRQNQLQGYTSGKTGKESLEEWFEVIKNRKRAGLDVLG